MSPEAVGGGGATSSVQVRAANAATKARDLDDERSVLSWRLGTSDMGLRAR
jgi:hypothetical protein